MANPFSAAKKWAKLRLESLKPSSKSTVNYSPLLEEELDLAEKFVKDQVKYKQPFKDLLKKHNITADIPDNMQLKQIKSVNRVNSNYMLIFSDGKKDMHVKCPRLLVKDLAAQQAKRVAAPLSAEDIEYAKKYLDKVNTEGKLDRVIKSQVGPIAHNIHMTDLKDIKPIKNSGLYVITVYGSERVGDIAKPFEIKCPREAIQAFATKEKESQKKIAEIPAKSYDPAAAPKEGPYAILLKDYNITNRDDATKERENFRNMLKQCKDNQPLLKLALASQPTENLKTMRDVSFKHRLNDLHEKDKTFYEKCTALINSIITSRAQFDGPGQLTSTEEALAMAYLHSHQSKLPYDGFNNNNNSINAIEYLSNGNCRIILEDVFSMDTDKKNWPRTEEIPMTTLKQYAAEQVKIEARNELKQELSKLAQGPEFTVQVGLKK